MTTLSSKILSLSLLALNILYDTNPVVAHDGKQHDSSKVRLVARQYQFQPITMLDEAGKTLSLPENWTSNSKIFLSLFYGDCKSLCPASLATMQMMDEKLQQKGLGTPILSLSIDPENDGPEDIASVAKTFVRSPHWTFAVADAEKIAVFLQELGLPRDFTNEAHAQAIYVIDTQNLTASFVPLNTSIEGMMKLAQ